MHHKPAISDALIRHDALHAVNSPRAERDSCRLLDDTRIAPSGDPAAARRYPDPLSIVPRAQSQSLGTPAQFEDRTIPGGAPIKGGLAGWQIRLIRKHVETKLGSTISIATLSQIARLSSGHFCRAFKISIGATPHTYVLRKRIDRAQHLMLTTTISLSEIALECGFTDQAHLTRLFKRFVGETPLAWRRTWKQAA